MRVDSYPTPDECFARLHRAAVRAKIAAARRGRPCPRHVVEAMRAANLGRPLSAETRRKMSEAHRRLGTRPPKAGRPWTPEEDGLITGELPPMEVAVRTGRTLSTVYQRRGVLGLPDGRRRGRAEPGMAQAGLGWLR
jgi:hypothetical protein